jgi:hypothetical protein
MLDGNQLLFEGQDPHALLVQMLHGAFLGVSLRLLVFVYFIELGLFACEPFQNSGVVFHRGVGAV